jgi:phenylalanyl-tRNA synthetase beta chain
MKVPLGWLREFIELERDPTQVADALTNAGIECSATVEGSLEGIVVGEVLEVIPHPGSDHLRICKVMGPGEEILSVVCGAPNVEKGVKAPLAVVGSVLPSGQKIEAAEIRGVRSEGMLCSEAELEVGEDASGIWILPAQSRTGARLDEELSLSDWVLELDVTPNRGDCLSIMGVAREVAAIFGLKVRPPQIELKEEGIPVANRFSVEIVDPQLCPRYVAKIVEGVKVEESPLWMRRRLQLAGLRPINNIVDVTNYVMCELGQPLHAFDLHLLEGSRIVVRRARQGERFISLDGQERVLNDEMLMIWDGEKPVAVAGVMGGENSEVRPDTADVLIESACFNPINIRRTAKALGIATEASRRFERSTDPMGCLLAANRAAQLMSQLSGGTVAPGEIDAFPLPPSPISINLRVSRVNALLGTELEARQVKDILDRLEIPSQLKDGSVLMVSPPTRRPDLQREVDLVEEVARILGYHRIPSNLPPVASAPQIWTPHRRVESVVREILTGWGLNEVITYSFIDEEAFDLLGIPKGDPMREFIRLRNPLRRTQGVMRTTLIPGLLDTVRRNFNRRNMDLRLFELGRVFIKEEGRQLPREPLRLGLVMTGRRFPIHWEGGQARVDFYDLKGLVEEILEELELLDEVEWVPHGLPPYLQEGVSARLVAGDETVGVLGPLSEGARAGWDLEEAPLIGEVDFEWLVGMGKTQRHFSPLPRFPEVTRDLSFVVEKGIEAARLVKEIRRIHEDISWFEDVMLFDIFEGEAPIPPGHRSLSFRLRYRHPERNLTDEEVNEQQEKVIQTLERKLGARLRS